MSQNKDSVSPFVLQFIESEQVKTWERTLDDPHIENFKLYLIEKVKLFQAGNIKKPIE